MGTKTTNKMDPAQEEFMQVVTGAAKDIYSKPYEAYTGERVAALDPMQQQAIAGYGALTLPSEYGVAGDVMTQLATRTPEERAAQLGEYTQQYTQNVIDPTIAAMERQRAQAVTGDEAALARAGAFGSRGDVYMGERQGAYEAQMGQTLGQLQAQGYQGAVARMQAEDAARASAAGQLAGLGGQQLQNQLGILGAQTAAGEMGRGYQQQMLDVPYQDYLAAQNYPLTQFGVLTGAAGAFPAGIGTETTSGPGYAVAALGSLGKIPGLF